MEEEYIFVDRVDRREDSSRGYGSISGNRDKFKDAQSNVTCFEKIGYGLGHFYNDLTACVWYSYTLFFMQSTLMLPPAWAGGLLLLGQAGDAMSTPIAGLIVDRCGTKRKWHLIGTGVTLATFPLLFSLCPWCASKTFWWEPLYFGLVILVFQFAWALVQVTHLAIIPEMSTTQQDRSDLVSSRYIFSVCAALFVHLATWYFFGSTHQIGDKIEAKGAYHFRDISLLLTFVGVATTFVFQISLSSSVNSYRPLELSYPTPGSSKNFERNYQAQTPSIKRIIEDPLMYQSIFLYVFSRCFMVLALVYLPPYLLEMASKVNKESQFKYQPIPMSVDQISKIPLASFITSIVAALIVNRLSRFCSTKLFYLFGSTIGLVACIWIAFGIRMSTPSYMYYIVAAAFGASTAMTLVSSLCFATNMIGNNSSQGGFIYSLISFSDKIISGAVILIIEALKCKDPHSCPTFYRNVLTSTCGTAAILGLLTVFTIYVKKRPSGIGAKYSKESSCYVIS